MASTVACSIDGCGRSHYSRGWCKAHYERARLYGHPLASKPPTPRKKMGARQRKYERIEPAVRFWAKIQRAESGCWIWQGALVRGYGSFQTGAAGGSVLAHRYAYELLVEPIPLGLTIDHLCRNTRCVNPSHLEPVTLAENIRRASQARSTAYAVWVRPL